MAVWQSTNGSTKTTSSIRNLDLSYDQHNSEESVRQLVYKIQPKWRDHPEQLEFVKFTDGITNTLLKIARLTPGASKDEIDHDSILMRAYGNNTDIIIDRDREAKSHALLAEKSMAPPLLARFRNGLLYRFIPGTVSTPEHLTQERVWRGVARKLGEWHARVPISSVATKNDTYTNGANGHITNGVNGHATNGINGHATNGVNHSTNGTNGNSNGVSSHKRGSRLLESRNPKPNFWSVVQGWIDALSTNTDKERARKEVLQQEIERCFRELDNKDGIGEQGLIFGHCDLLSANVILLPTSPDAAKSSNVYPVTFIDYEYATPCPAAFDIANHFAEWAGYDLDYNRLPTRAVRREFLREYIASYNQHNSVKIDEDAVLSSLYNEIERYRGMPGLYWGIWALIQAKISEIDFDYAQYAEDRLSEYWAWRAARDGVPPAEGKAVPARERRWNQD